MVIIEALLVSSCFLPDVSCWMGVRYHKPVSVRWDEGGALVIMFLIAMFLLALPSSLVFFAGSR